MDTTDTPKGSNADEWALFLSEHSNAIEFVAVQIACAIEEAYERGIKFERFGLTARFHDGSWWAYDVEHDSDTGPYSTKQEALDWIDDIHTKGQS